MKTDIKTVLQNNNAFCTANTHPEIHFALYHYFYWKTLTPSHSKLEEKDYSIGKLLWLFDMSRGKGEVKLGEVN